ncbi:MAG: hypothetical protein WCP96_06975 [Methylococcaceae bacterium]
MQKQQLIEAAFISEHGRVSSPRLSVTNSLPLPRFNGAMRSAGKVFVAGVVLCASLASLPAFANTLYSQPPVTGQFSSTLGSQADAGFSNSAAWVNDDFLATQSGAVSNISWQGDAQPTGNSGFTISIFPAVVNGNPYTPVLPELATVAPLMTFTVSGNAGQTLNSVNLYNFNAVLPTPFTLVKGTRYWLNIESNGVHPWGWANGSGGNFSINYCQQGPYVCTAGVSDRAFSLNDTAVTASLGSGEAGFAYPLTALAGTHHGNSLADPAKVPPGIMVKQGATTLLISGTPTLAGNYQFAVVGNATDDIFNIKIVSRVALSTTSLPNGTEGVAYYASVAATGGETPYNWAISGLPKGLTYAVSKDTKTVSLSGVPVAGTAVPAPYKVAVTIIDAAKGAINQPQLGLTIGH